MMLLSPRKVKFQKQYSRNDVIKTKNEIDSLNLGYYALYAEQNGKICGKQIEAIRLVLRRMLKRQAKI
jgi:ribosomal protein L16/L10AE